MDVAMSRGIAVVVSYVPAGATTWVAAPGTAGWLLCRAPVVARGLAHLHWCPVVTGLACDKGSLICKKAKYKTSNIMNRRRF